MLRLTHLYAIAPGYALKPANSAPTPTGPADHLQPIACATASHRFQQPSSEFEARRPTSLPVDPPAQAAWLGPDRCSVALRSACTPASHAMQGPTLLARNTSKKTPTKKVLF
jgi:hypothetical protein